MRRYSHFAVAKKHEFHEKCGVRINKAISANQKTLLTTNQNRGRCKQTEPRTSNAKDSKIGQIKLN